MDLEKIKQLDWPAVFGRALKNGGWLAEAFYEDAAGLSIQLEQKKLEKAVSGRDVGLGLRILFDDKTAYGYTTEITEPGILELADELSLAVKADPAQPPAPLRHKAAEPIYKIVKPYQSVELSAKADLVRRADEAAWAVDGRIRQAKTALIEKSQTVFIANSLGTAVVDTRHNIVFLCQVVAADGQVIQTGYQPVGGTVGWELFDDNPPEQVAREAAGRAILMLESEPAPGGRMPVVIGGSAGGTMIHEAVGHGLEADLALEDLSVYTGKLGQPVASDLVTVWDDATIPQKRGSFGFDDEGTCAEKTVLIENGLLKAYMTDRLYARKGEIPLTGNGRRESFRHRPVVRMTNTLIAPGKTDPDEIVKATDQGFYVAKMGGGQVNTANGEFVFEVSEGYLIESGAIGRPVRGATLVGNGPAALMGIDLVGSDLGYAIGTCGKDGQGVPVGDAQPTLRIAELLVGGAV